MEDICCWATDTQCLASGLNLLSALPPWWAANREGTAWPF